MATLIWDNGGVGSLWSTAANWDTNTVPQPGDDINFKSLSLADSTCDIASVGDVTVDVLYTGVITQIANLFVSSAFTMTTNATQDWITNGNDLNIDGDINQTGTGVGITHNAGGTLRLGGDIDIDTADLTSPVVIHHSVATPTAAKTHEIINASGSKFVNLTVVDNQSIGGSISFWCDNVAWGDNINISGFGLLVANSAGTAWTGVENITWTGDSINSIALRWNQLTQLPVSDYGNIEVEYRSDTDFAVGTYKTTGKFDLGFNFGTSHLDMPSGCTFLLGEISIGVAGAPTLGCILTQKAGSSLQVTGDAIVRQDDTIQENKWVREAGVLDTVIGGSFTVEADAGLDLTDDDSTISWTTDTDISTASSCAFGEASTVEHIGTGTAANNSYTNKFAGFKPAAAGHTTTLVDRVRMGVGTSKLSFGGGTFDFNGQELGGDPLVGEQFINAENTTFIGNGTISIVPNGDMSFNGGNFGSGVAFTMQLSGPASPDAISINGPMVTGTVFLTESGSSTLLVKLYHDWHMTGMNWGFGTRGASIEFLGGNIIASGKISFHASSQVLGSGNITCNGLELIAGSTFDSTDINIINSGEHTVDPAATFLSSNGTYTIFGSNDQDITTDTSTFNNLIENKTGGSVNYLDDWVATGEHIIMVQEAYTATYLASGVYGSDKLTILPLNVGIPSATRLTIQSDDTGVTQFDYTVNDAGPAWKNVDVADMNYLGADQDVDTNTGSDGGNNNTSPPTPGLVFLSVPAPPPSGDYGYGVYTHGAGMGEGEGLGGAFPYGLEVPAIVITSLQVTNRDGTDVTNRDGTLVTT